MLLVSDGSRWWVVPLRDGYSYQCDECHEMRPTGFKCVKTSQPEEEGLFYCRACWNEGNPESESEETS